MQFDVVNARPDPADTTANVAERALHKIDARHGDCNAVILCAFFSDPRRVVCAYEACMNADLPHVELITETFDDFLRDWEGSPSLTTLTDLHNVEEPERLPSLGTPKYSGDEGDHWTAAWLVAAGARERPAWCNVSDDGWLMVCEDDMHFQDTGHHNESFLSICSDGSAGIEIRDEANGPGFVPLPGQYHTKGAVRRLLAGLQLPVSAEE